MLYCHWLVGQPANHEIEEAVIIIKIDAKNDVPIFVQIAHMLEDYILDGRFVAEQPILSTTQLSKLLKVNPDTAIKGVSILVDQRVLYKRRGIGMYVSKEAKVIIKDKRKKSLKNETVKNLIDECKKLGVAKDEIIEIIKEDWRD